MSVGEIITGIVDDYLGCHGVPTNFAKSVYATVMGKRRAAAREILLLQVRQGDFSRIHEEEAVSIIARFLRDAEEGVARNNLRLMARVIRGMADEQELKAPSFLKFANILASLTEEEIIVLGIMAKDAKGNFIHDLFGGSPKEMDIGFTKNPGENELKKVIPQYEIVQQALVRTGLIAMYIESEKPTGLGVNQIGAPEKIDSEIIFKLTPLMGEILKYTDFLIPAEAA